MAVAKLTSKGQLVVPKPIRQHLHRGDIVDFVIQDNGEVVRPATRDVQELKGILPKPKKAVSLDEMARAIRESAGKMR